MTPSGFRRHALAAAGLLGALIAWAAPPTARAAEDDFLPVEQAFEYAVTREPGALVVAYNVRDGYYLYRKRIGFATDTPGITLGAVDYPKGSAHHDDYFGDQEVYRGAAAFRVPYTISGAAPAAIDLKLKLQGCADKGLCYPPQVWTAHVALGATAAAAAAPAGAAPGGLLGKLVPGAAATAPADDFLPVEEAFRFTASADGGSRVRLHFVIAEGYYLYRARIRVSGESTLAALGAPDFPQGLPHHDDYFGDQEIYRGELDLPVPYARSGPAAGTLALKVVYQGCADKGLCYPPQTANLTLALPAGDARAGGGPAAPSAGAPVSEQDRLARLIRDGNLLLVVATFFGFGLLLAFTPCVLPMVPILSGIIAGDGAQTTPARGFALSLAYVSGMALTYTVAGAIFAMAGHQAQAFFQQTWIIVGFALMFVALSLAMFGVYELQMPSGLQTMFAGASNRIRGGKFVSTAIMGALSSLVVTACVAPPLVAALAVIGQAGDVGRGALALLALSFGMGTPLLVVGASAGTLLPKAGPWMETVKAIFGVVFVGVAVWMLDRVLPARLEMLAWGVVAASAAWVALRIGLRGGRRTALRQVIAGLAAAYALLLVAGAIGGGENPLKPLAGTGLLGASARAESLPWRPVRSVADLDRELAAATAAGRRTMLDFSADWCVSCKEMEAHTFSDPAVRAALAGYVLLRADVTANNDDDQALLKRFRIIGPPTTAFFAPDGRERGDYRLVGFVAPAAFRTHLGAFEAAP
ncbi:MAG: protein-disulfide reductase DsbD [Proteobacteria bacterium]|nr:protein-disulfide reductase DsbD [Pseudomonadota bacterium]